MKKELDIIVPLKLDYSNNEQTIDAILLQSEKYGFKKFALTIPLLGFRSKGYPEKKVYERFAEAFIEVRDAVKNKGISLGWWNSLTVKSGRNASFTPVTKSNGTEHPFANCCLDKNFQKAFAENVTLFTKIANPEFITFEDDYSVSAASGWYGCFCPLHLAEFSKREGKNYSREELIEIFTKRDPESLALLFRYRTLLKDGLVELANVIRAELDKVSKKTPIMLLESGSIDLDGGATEEVSRALAGTNPPSSRLYGCFYCSGETKNIPAELYHAIYMKENVGEDFRCYHESDTYPHIRYFTSAKQMQAMMSVVFSSGFCGAIFQNSQCTTHRLDYPCEDQAYSKMFNKERDRFNEAYRKSSLCERGGVELPYDAFYNRVDQLEPTPFWTRAVSLFGIPFTTRKKNVAFIDERQAKYMEKEELLRYLSGTLFLDGDGAKTLCEKGYTKYLGVTVGDIAFKDMAQHDLDAREVITPEYSALDHGRVMPSAHAYAVGRNGALYSLIKTDEKCETVTETFDFENNFISVGTTYYENELGGKVIVMGMTLKNNLSQSLFNYRRQRLIQDLLSKCGADFPMLKNEPNVHLIFNKAKDSASAGFSYMLTLINLGDDELDNVTIKLPPNMINLTPYIMTEKGEWEKAKCKLIDNELMIDGALNYCDPIYLLFK